MSIVPGGMATLISCVYPPDDPLRYVMLFDNSVLAWQIDDAGGAPPVPVIIGTQPAMVGPDTGAIFSPAWAVRDGPTVFIPDIARGSANEFFNFVATNGGVLRPVYAKFSDFDLATAWNEWAKVNPTLYLKDVPGPPEAEDDGGLERQQDPDRQDPVRKD